MPGISGFILGFEQKPGQQSRKNRSRNPACGSLQPAGEDTEKSVLGNCFLHTLGKKVTKARQGYRGTGPGEIGEGLIDADPTM